MKLSSELERLYTPDRRIDGGRALDYVYKAMLKMSNEEFLRIASMPAPLKFGPHTKLFQVCPPVGNSTKRLRSRLKRIRRR